MNKETLTSGAGYWFIIFWVRGSVPCLEIRRIRPPREKNLKNARRRKAESCTDLSERPCYSSRERRAGPRGTVTVLVSWFFWEFVSLENLCKMAKWNSSTVGVRPGRAFVVSHRVEQSDLRERWFCVHFHFGCGIKRLSMERGVWVYESTVLLPLGSCISRL